MNHESIQSIEQTNSPENGETQKLQWWQEGAAYQVYPRSFQDSNGDGIGDLGGITNRLDHIQDLGINMLWLSPIFPDGGVDGGYDITDYSNIAPQFGTMNDFKVLIREADKRGINVILDLVIQHTSDKHPWFLESSSSRNNPKSDWYKWADPGPDGGPPNKWLSLPPGDGPAWTNNPARQQYYHHLFTQGQPDLNIVSNEALQAEVFKMMRGWFDIGVKGFREDVLSHLRALPDLNGDPHYHQYERVYEMVAKMQGLFREYGAVSIGEVNSGDTDHLRGLYKSGLNLPFNLRNFPLLAKGVPSAQELRQELDTYNEVLTEGTWGTNVLENHDNLRLASRVGQEYVPLFQTYLFTAARATPFIFAGGELGMPNSPVTKETNLDPQAYDVHGNYHPERSRDYARGPMQWDASPNAGFSLVDPVSPVHPNYRNLNATAQRGDRYSMLNTTKRLLQARQENQAILEGRYVEVPQESQSDSVVIYGREAANSQKALVILNLSRESQTIQLPQNHPKAKTLFSTNPDYYEEQILHRFSINPFEARILEIQ